MTDTPQSLPSVESRHRLLHVAILSALGLAFELILIRWVDSEIRPLAFVKNLTLISAFLGLGIGYASEKGHRTLIPWAPFLLALLLGCGSFLGSDTASKFWSAPLGIESNLSVRTAARPADLTGFVLAIVASFVLTTLAMVPVGQLTAEYLRGLPPVRAYTANVAGSLVGVLAVFALSFLSMPPWAGAALCSIVFLAYLWPWLKMRTAAVAAVAIALAAMIALDRHTEFPTVWSPYNKIEVERQFVNAGGQQLQAGWNLKVQNFYYQQVVDLSDAALAKFPVPQLKQARFEYDFPYRWKKNPGSVLVLGAGTGNDVAAALRAGARHVDAVEIDPRISDFGVALHAERPYRDPRVRIINTDARAFLKSRGDQYDMIVFGLLDAHTGFFSSLAGGIRLDNYVYTVDSFRQALSRLKPGGLLALSFYVERPWIATRMSQMLAEAWGKPPTTARISNKTVTYLAGDGAPAPGPFLFSGMPADFAAMYPAGPSATDDWPFLYLRGRAIPPTLIWAGLAVLLVGGILVRLVFRHGVRFERQFFFLGAGFLLLETRTIAQLALLYGTTWRVSAVTIAAILLVILLANVYILKRGPLPLGVLYPILVVLLIVNWFVRPGLALGHGQLMLVAITALLAAPILLAALIFGSAIAHETELSPLLASNLIGAVLGGLLENGSLLFGISSLNLLAVAVYLASISLRRARIAA